MRFLAAIRLDEVLVLQGTPLMGALLAGRLDIAGLALLLLGNGLLVAHVFALNDYAGLVADARDSARTQRGLGTSGLSRSAMKGLIVALLVLALAVLAGLGFEPVYLGAFLAMLSALYSVPRLHWKGVPVVCSALHLSGGAAHFLLGYASFSPLDTRALAISLFFGLAFAAGHLTHEARDHAADLGNSIRTNAVQFSPRTAFLWGLALFTLTYLLMALLALRGDVPTLLAATPLLLPFHLWGARRALQAGLTHNSLLTLQWQYRALFAFVGVVALAASTIS